jgi:hypothetical protein
VSERPDFKAQLEKAAQRWQADRLFDALSSNVYTAVYGKVAPVPPTPPTRWQRRVGRVRRCWLDVRYWLAFRICPELEAWIDNGDL